MKDLSLDEATGDIAVGSLIMAGLAAALQAFVDLKPFLADFGDSVAWKVFIAVPLVVLSYLLGVVTVALSAWWLDHRNREGVAEQAWRYVLVGRVASDFVVTEYKRALREVKLLQACCPAIGCLALGLGMKVLLATPAIGGRLAFGRAVFASLALVLLGGIPAILAITRRKRAFLAALIRELQAGEHAAVPLKIVDQEGTSPRDQQRR